MKYSNLQNEAVTEEKTGESSQNDENVEVRNEAKKPQDLLMKKEGYWFIAMVLTFLLLGCIIFYMNHTTGGPKYSTTPTLPPVTITKELLYTAQGYKYYKVSVRNGTRLTEGQVSNTCEGVGMRAVCSGDTNCKYSSNRCLVTPLSTNCNNPMYPLSKILCSGSKPRNCDQFEGVFSYMSGWYGGECGRVGYDWCANGDDFVAGTVETSPGRVQKKVEAYYAYCAKEA